jgi:hypothetical protein
MATVIKAFNGVEDGNVYPRLFEVGDEVEGDLARVAIEEGWAAEGLVEAAKKTAEKVEEGLETAVGGLTSETIKKALEVERLGDAVADKIAVPVDWRSMKWGPLRALAEKITGGDIASPDEARKAIEAEITRQKE